MSAYEEPYRNGGDLTVWGRMGAKGPFSWLRDDSDVRGLWRIAARGIPNLVPSHFYGTGESITVYDSLMGHAADDGFGNLVLLGGLQ